MKVITVAAAIIVNEQQQLLLVRKQNTACFMQVGGKLEPNEEPEQTMLREIRRKLEVMRRLNSLLVVLKQPRPMNLILNW